MTTSESERVFVLGIDGVPWDLLSKWSRRDELSNFKQIFEEGASGPLESTVPPNTALAWPSITTGVRPDKHGIYSFRKVQSNHSNKMSMSTDKRHSDLWDMLSPSVVGNVPMTYPAREIDGKVVTGMMTPSRDAGFTHPESLSKEIEEVTPNYEIGLDWNKYSEDEETFLEELSQLLEARRELMRHLMKTQEWELFFFVYTGLDRLQHLIWDEEVLLEYYKEIDEILGEVMEYTEENASNLFVVSDHGFGPISKFVNLNSILAENGFLQQSDDRQRNLLSQIGVTKANLTSILESVNLYQPLVRNLPKPVLNNITTRVPGNHELFDVNFTNTIAFAYGYGNIYINYEGRFEEGAVREDERAEIKERLYKIFDNYQDPEAGNQPIDVYDGEKVFPTDLSSPDLVVVGKDGYEVKTSISSSAIRPATKKAASHESTGILLAKGPSIGKVDVSGASVLDIVPTILHSLGRPIPTSTDGDVLDIFEIGSPPAENGIERTQYTRETTSTTETDQDFKDVKERLEGLGYIE